MVTTEVQTGDRKESTKKKVSGKKKAHGANVWPCKINGCNKQFAREADLKRHQRTTKTHSIPGFACPQCDATFTRADALRRHQKSRHNGVVIEPSIDLDKVDELDDCAASSSNHSRSSSVAPSSKGKERDVSYVPATTPRQPPVRESAPNGATSYYRAHTATSTTAYPPRLTPAMVHQYGQVELPTSATRLNQATWGPSQARAEEPPQMNTINYHQVPGAGTYYTSSHYRLNDYANRPARSRRPRSRSRTSSDSRSSRTASPVPGSRKHEDFMISRPTSRSHSPPVPVIDPFLDHPSGPPRIAAKYRTPYHDNGSSSTDRPDIKADLHSDHSATQHQSPKSDDERSPCSRILADNVKDERIRVDATPSRYSASSLKRPEPMEPMLTEDGEPMLNPAELLTQESLASPPPS